MMKQNEQERYVCLGNVSNHLDGQKHLNVFTGLACNLSTYSKQLEGTEAFLSILDLSFSMQYKLMHCTLRELPKGTMTYSETVSVFLLSTSMELDRETAFIQPMYHLSPSLYFDCLQR